MGRPLGQLARALTSLTVGIHDGSRERRRALADTATGEYQQQVHVPLSGQAAPTWAFVDKTVNWELPFLYAPLQRVPFPTPFPTPHFTAGVEFTAGTGELIVIHAHVIGWTVSDSGWFTGATVRFGVSAPNAADPIAYSAIAHLTFESYATSPEGGELTA